MKSDANFNLNKDQNKLVEVFVELLASLLIQWRALLITTLNSVDFDAIIHNR